jgi:dienelactone hydrolase
VLRLVAEHDAGDAFAAAVAFYPGCRGLVRQKRWRPRLPLLIQIGEADDWTPVEQCQLLLAKVGKDRVKMDVYPNAYHDFDTPDLPVRVRKGVAFSARGDGVVHVGTNEEARKAAIAATLTFFAQHLKAKQRQ